MCTGDMTQHTSDEAKNGTNETAAKNVLKKRNTIRDNFLDIPSNIKFWFSFFQIDPLVKKTVILSSSINSSTLRVIFFHNFLQLRSIKQKMEGERVVGSTRVC